MSRVGFGVVLGDEALVMALKDAELAERSRRGNGARETLAHREYRLDLHRAVSSIGHLDVQAAPEMHTVVTTTPTVEIATAANRLGISRRQATRYARQLGGKKISGRWFVDEDLLDEMENKKCQH